MTPNRKAARLWLVVAGVLLAIVAGGVYVVGPWSSHRQGLANFYWESCRLLGGGGR